MQTKLSCASFNNSLFTVSAFVCFQMCTFYENNAFRAHFYTERVIPIWNHLPHDVVTSLNITVFRTRLLDLLTYHPFVRYIPSMFRQFVSARTHRATTCLLAYVCVFICMQSIKKWTFFMIIKRHVTPQCRS